MNGAILPELHDAVFFRIKGEIISPSDEKARFETCAALADNNASCADGLPGINLDPEALGIRITPVGAAALTLGMRHNFLSELHPSLLPGKERKGERIISSVKR